MEVIKAGDLKVGMQLVEQDGFLFDVVEIVLQTDTLIKVRVCSDLSSIESHWTTKKDGSPGGKLIEFPREMSIYISR